MSHKIALTVASATAALTLAVALAAAGFAPGTPAAAASSAPIADQVVADPSPAVQVDTVYLAPVPKRKTVTVHKVIKTTGGEHESEHESEGDD